jgi:DNA-binding protein HU-beta
MTKAEIIVKMAEDAKIAKAAAAIAFQSVISCIEESLKKGEKTTIVGFGTFSVTDRKARIGRNPRTGKEVKIAAKKAPKFSAGAPLKAALNKRAAAPAKKVATKVATKPAAKAKKK